jgi:hypothetical protein
MISISTHELDSTEFLTLFFAQEKKFDDDLIRVIVLIWLILSIIFLISEMLARFIFIFFIFTSVQLFKTTYYAIFMFFFVIITN